MKAVTELVDTKFKRISMGITTLLFILLFILFFLVSWTIPDPMPEVEPRIEIIPVDLSMQGAMEGEQGGSLNDTPYEKPVSTENAKPTPNTSPKVTTQETSTVSVPTGTNNNATPTVNQNALFTKPTGNGSGSGDGDGDGPGHGTGDTGPGHANGHGNGTVGTGYSLSGRSALDKPAPKNVTQKEGKIVINIWVDRNGKVIRTKFNPDLSTINDSQLTAECEKAAKKTVWSENEDAEEEQRGSITYNFKLN